MDCARDSPVRTKRFSSRLRCPRRPKVSTPTRRGPWYLKVTLGRDPLTGKREQITRKGFRTATEAAKVAAERLAPMANAEFVVLARRSVRSGAIERRMRVRTFRGAGAWHDTFRAHLRACVGCRRDRRRSAGCLSAA
ncbi:MAG: Arm DNA-binding domain-containing protein [Acidimicrobiales bacterium]